MVRVATSEYSDQGGSIAAGSYHFLIEKAEWSEQYGSLIVDSKILSGTVPTEAGKTHREFFKLDNKAANRFNALLVATGITTKKRLNALKDANQDLEVDENALVGRSFCGHAKMESYGGKDPDKQGKHFPQLGFDIFSVRDTAAVGILKQPAAERLMLAILQKADPMQLPPQEPPHSQGNPVKNPSGPNGTDGNGASHPAQPAAPPATAPAAATAMQSWDDFFG